MQMSVICAQREAARRQKGHLLVKGSVRRGGEFVHYLHYC